MIIQRYDGITIKRLNNGVKPIQVEQELIDLILFKGMVSGRSKTISRWAGLEVWQD